jgi:hypothetical protein
MALLFLPFVSMLSQRAHELEVVSEEEQEQEKKGGNMNQGKNDTLTSPQDTLMQPFISMLRPRAYECNKTEAPKNEEWERCNNE